MSNKSKSLEEYLSEATQNINNDRAIAHKLLLELVNKMGEDNNKYVHKDFGEVASKYLETLQRSNEQLVKIASIIQKRDGVQDALSAKEKDEIFDLIKENK
jgi:DNA-binding PucR family transcriptional regulator